MKISVLIERDPETGFLAAWAVQGKLRGENMLKGRRIKRVDAAIERCDETILGLYKLLDPPEISYIPPGEAAPSPQIVQPKKDL